MGTRVYHFPPDLCSFLAITVVIFFFFAKLFWPIPQILITPDFGKSDSWHFSFATKYVLWESLHKGKLPLWSPGIGAGFPVLAEGQIGTFFLPNLIIFRLVPDPVTAYNVSLVTTILLFAWGVYVWLRSIRILPIASLFGSLTLTLSGVVILQLPHITLLQGFSLMPWVLAATNALMRNPSGRRIGAVACIVSQQVFTGFPQATFLTLLLATGWIFWAAWQKETSLGTLVLFGVSVLLGAGLSAIQLVPSWEFLRQTTLPNGLPPDIASYFSFPLAHLGSFIQPFVLGDPRIGTYPHFASFDGSIFWENTGYIGLLPLVLTIPTLWYKHTKIRFFLCVIAVSFLLMWGSHSPLYIIYSIWPFNLFRVPSRFLWLFVFSIVTLASIGLNYLMQNLKNKFLFISLIMLAAANVIHLFVLWQNYHLFVSARDWMNPPQILTLIPSAARIYTIGSEITHNKFFLSQGWKNTSPFVFLRNDLAPDSNLIWGRANFGVYAGRTLRRTDIFSALLAQNVHISENQATPSALYKTLLDVSSVTTLISTVPLDESQIHDSKKPFKREKVYTGAGTTLYLYTNPNARPRAYLASGAKTVSTVEDSARALADNPSERNVLVERRLPFTEQKSGGTVQVRDTNDTNVSIAVENNPGDAILVLTDTIYPGWIARTDGEVTPIVPVNIQFRGIKIPAGTHSITFEYKPASFRIGATVTSIFMIIIVFLAVFPELFARGQTRQKAPQRDWHFQYNHDRSKLHKA